ncbi:hypothetical protein [Sphingobacterium sp.]|uniref:hypothetical protein n=1 Tax=Sphingobacterium sp. TaxID=341027 RepID=UPI002897E0AB|nr:hypothetical protein [Sphingobacterium sp.]
MKLILKIICSFFISVLIFGCSKDSEPAWEWGGPDPLAYNIQTTWLAVEQKSGDGQWVSLNGTDTLKLSFNYNNSDNSILSTNGVYFMKDNLLGPNIFKFGYFKTANSLLSLTFQRSADDKPHNIDLAISSQVSEESDKEHILMITNNQVNPNISIKFKNIEFNKLQ